MADLVGWLAGQGHRLYIQRDAEQETPSQGWLGSESDTHPWAYALIPSELDRWLRGAGYRPAEVLGNWSRRGWLLQTRGKRVRVQIDGRRCLCVGILRHALDEVGAGE
jgi:hypothetical protein